jgi:uncharacterized protein (DUF1330 family)
MSKGYWVVKVDASDDGAYARYLQLNAALLARFGGRALNRRGPVEAVDGKSFRRTMIEFPTAEAALKCLGDPQFLKDNPPGGRVALLEIIAAEEDGPPGT